MESASPNTVAGSSTPRSSPSHPTSSANPSNTPRTHADQPSQLFFPTPGLQQLPAYIQSTQDLLRKLHLHDAYDKYVRLFNASSDDAPIPNDRNEAVSTSPPTTGQNGLMGASDKGKGKEVAPAPMAQTPAADGQDGDDDNGPGGKGEKKKKNSYKHLIKGVPGKHSLKKDDNLTKLMLAPLKQRV
ncbi:uncharacterized protein C8R40DRAFT_1178222 [Lentinula edodes]|uniref:uncharacterized protein n=1 Tax=Lentinula edodes TaxID=5353 RepID=UPI001E8E7705|nr:uncharacterized protein C8R40DRAFT_1178222 [Lentinula edodes]KAH7868109.1 hypothetical protein C8R40DRAFT_1178222 [Lentinula edodes]